MAIKVTSLGFKKNDTYYVEVEVNFGNNVKAVIGVGMILKLGGLNHGEHVRSGTLSIISHFKDYVHK